MQPIVLFALWLLLGPVQRDTPSMFRGYSTTYIEVPGSPLELSAGAGICLSEDLPDPAFENRFRVTVWADGYQIPEELTRPWSYAGPVKVSAVRRWRSGGPIAPPVAMGTMSIVAGKLHLECAPLSEEVLAVFAAAAPGSETRQQRVTALPIPFGFEVLIEERK